MKNVRFIHSPDCVFNSGVTCSDRSKCTKCGWRPAVSRRRIEALAEGGK